MVNKSGPNTDPCGTPQVRLADDDFEPQEVTQKDLDSRYDLNQESAEPEMPNQSDKRCKRIE